MTILLGAISGISLLVGGIGIMNIMYVSVGGRGNHILASLNPIDALRYE